MAFDWISKTNLKYLIDKIKGYIDTYLAGKSDSNHTHDSRYYTETEIDNKIATVNSNLAKKQDTDTAITTSNIGSQTAGYINVYNAPHTADPGYVFCMTASGGYADGMKYTNAGELRAGYLLQSGDYNYPMRFSWAGKGGQPTWLWGGDNWDNMYVYNPSNFSVNYANSAGSAQPVFNNATWYNVGDDIKMGDQNVGGALCLQGITGDSTNIYMLTQNGAYGGWIKLTSDGSMHLMSNSVFLKAGNNGIAYLQVHNRVSVVNLANSTWMPIYAAAFTVNSSKVVKENIVDMPKDKAMKILNLRVVEFDYINGAKNQCGLIAEEVIDILPYCVDIPEDYSKEKALEQIANGELPDVPGIDYSKLVAPLIKLVQMQQEQIELLTHKVDELINFLKCT